MLPFGNSQSGGISTTYGVGSVLLLPIGNRLFVCAALSLAV